MTIYNVNKAYRQNDDVYYQVLPYQLNFTIWKYYGFVYFIKFLMRSHLSEKKANKVAKNKMK